MNEPICPPPAPRLAPIQPHDDDDITPLSLSEDTIAVKSNPLAGIVQPLNYDSFNEHPYQPITSVATPSSVLFGTQPELASVGVQGTSCRSFISGLLSDRHILQVPCRCPNHINTTQLPFPSHPVLAVMLYSISIMTSLSCPGPSNLFKAHPQLRNP